MPSLEELEAELADAEAVQRQLHKLLDETEGWDELDAEEEAFAVGDDERRDITAAGPRDFVRDELGRFAPDEGGGAAGGNEPGAERVSEKLARHFKDAEDPDYSAEKAAAALKDFEGLSVKELKEVAEAAGVFINKPTKRGILDQIERKLTVAPRTFGRIRS